MSEAIVLAGANRSALYASEEGVWGETPVAASMAEIQRVSDTLDHTKITVVPRTLRTDRAREDLVRVGEQAGGGIVFELRHTQYDNYLAALLGASAFTSVSIAAATDIAVATADNSINATTTNFVTAGIVVGMNLRLAGFVASSGQNNRIAKVLTVTTTKVTFVADTPDFVDEAAGPSVTITGKMARNGTTKRSYYLERSFLEIPLYQQFSGMMMNQLALTMNARNILQATLSMVGKRGDVMNGTTTSSGLVAAADNPAMDATNNLLSITESGVAFSQPVMNTSMTLNNNLALREVVSNRYPIGVRWGTLDITGTLEAYFFSVTVWNEFVNHGHPSLVYRFRDPNNKELLMTFPRIFFETSPLPVTGENTDVMATMTYRAVIDKTLGYMAQLDSLA